MKQLITLPDTLYPSVRDYILIWKKRKYSNDTPTLSIGECIELLIATTYSFHVEHSDGRFFNNILINEESVIAWDGDELIDTLFYQIEHNIKIRISRSRTFNEVVE